MVTFYPNADRNHRAFLRHDEAPKTQSILFFLIFMTAALFNNHVQTIQAHQQTLTHRIRL